MLLFAHRGFHNRKIAENTLEAFERAIDEGADGIEFDLRISRDGVPMVVHDENLHRVAGDARRVRDLTGKELQDVSLRGSGYVPTLNEVTSSWKSPVQFLIEVKDRDACELLIQKLSTSAKLRERTIVASFVLDDIERLRRNVPDVRTLYYSKTWPLPGRGRRIWSAIEKIAPWGMGFPVNTLSKRRILIIREKGFRVASWDLQPLKRETRKLLKYDLDIAVAYKIDIFLKNRLKKMHRAKA